MAEPIDWQTVEVVLEGLSQKDDKKATTPGKLRTALNVEFDKTHSLNKRRGFVRIPFEELVHDEQYELLYAAVATYQQELVVYGLDNLNSVVARTADVSGAAMVRRGPTMRGNYRVHDVYASPLGGALLRALTEAQS